MEHGVKLLPITLFIVFIFQLHQDSVQQASKNPTGMPEHPANKNSKENLPTPKGVVTNLGDLSIYETEYKNNSTIALIAVYDLFGFHPHVKYVADEIAEGEDGIRVVIPDFFHGKPYDAENFPPPNFQNEVDELFKREGMWAKTVKTDLKNVIEHYKTKGILSFGIFGFCWGGKMSVYAASDSDFSATIKAAGLVRPSKVTTSDADNAHCPMILLPSKDEPDMIPFLNKLESLFKGKSEHKRFSDMRHGFAGGRSDFNNPTVKLRVRESVQLLKSYFGRLLH